MSPEQPQPQNYWDSEDFEDTVASALIACFESKIRRDRTCDERNRLTDARLAYFRSEGPYIPGRSETVAGQDDSGRFFVDLPTPSKGVFAFRPEGRFTEGYLGDSYLSAISFRRAPKLGEAWHSMRHGTPFEIIRIGAGNDGLRGDRTFVTVAPDGEVRAAQYRTHDRSVGHKFGGRQVVVTSGANEMFWESRWAAMALEVVARRRTAWSITAQESNARAHLGCMTEEVKSLLYARSLPMTATGRKRPILHLVEAHKRRMRSGVDIPVSAFLRGLQVVEIGGTIFKVNPPAAIQPAVSKPSRERYFGETAPA